MVTTDDIVDYIVSAIPERLRYKIPYEDAVGLIADRWVYSANRADPDNALISLLMLYYTTERGMTCFTWRTQQRIIQDFNRRLGSFRTYSNDIAESLYNSYRNGVPLSVLSPYLGDLIMNKLTKSIRLVTTLGIHFCSDIDPDDCRNVMTQKTTGQRLLT